MPASNRAALRQRLEAIVREAGDLARMTARGPFKRWTKGDDKSPVSEGDIAVNNFLQARLSALLPQAGWLSEETEDHPPDRAMASTWVVDPIDGTRAYIMGRADWTVAVALVEDGRPTIAALYAPVTDEMFLAVKEEGATLNGAPIQATKGAMLDNASLTGPQRYLKQFEAMNPHIRLQPKVFSLALRFARVAQGELDAAFASHGSHDWDLAAADLILHEAGGTVTDFAGRTLRYNRPSVVHESLIAAGRARHAALLELARDRQHDIA
ncbi:MAG TPA: 3'(2'),5'-bisphosphate nucleotidase CysQ [Pseudolabrys sp.]|nr:3'(2'),5'-bisphosphate nucleotidase CysQ [Pseudolabrys sp.]